MKTIATGSPGKSSQSPTKELMQKGHAVTIVSTEAEEHSAMIVGQQISVTAANAIYARLRALFVITQSEPAILAQTPMDELPRIGLSTRKAEYVRDLARRAAGGELDELADLPHEEARKRLVTFRGIGGPWIADGALLITFGWADELVSGDLVLRKAVQRAYGLPQLPSVLVSSGGRTAPLPQDIFPSP